MDFEALEDAAIAQLLAAPGLPEQVRIAAWPDKPQETGKPTGKAAIFVRFAGFDLRPPESRNRVNQLQRGSVDLELRFLVKDLRSHSGAYPLMAIALAQLGGWRPPLGLPFAPGLQGFYLVSQQLVDRFEQVWDWGARYRMDFLLEQNLK